MSAARVFAFLLAAGAAVDASADATDDFVRTAMLRERIPGCAVAVVRGGDTVKAAGYGIEDLESGVPVSADTYFEIGSITKTFTAQAVLLLVEDGALALDDPLAKHLDGLPHAWRSLTLRQLLTHTSSIVDRPEAAASAAVPLGDFLGRYFADAGAGSVRTDVFLDAGPGRAMRYSN
ncbi:MAG TPA: serine hydrolase domain-containing protein, partial [Xanthomonadales bacterium]|nr:serine hydrolase domain-containing protein [Xanthomonadales bacterium]